MAHQYECSAAQTLCAGRMALHSSLGDHGSTGRHYLSTCFSDLEFCIRPASLLQATQRAALPKIFENATTGIVSQHLNLLDILRRVADDGSRSFRGWFGFFSLPQCDSIESIGPAPLDTVVNPLWDLIIAAVESSWTAFKLRPSQLTYPAPGTSSLEAQLLEGCIGVASPLANMHDAVLTRSAFSPSCAAPVLGPGYECSQSAHRVHRLSSPCS